MFKNAGFSFLFLIVILANACSGKQLKKPYAVIRTSYGNISVELNRVKAPKTVEAFISIANKGLYNNSSFYRVLKNDMLTEQYNNGVIQGGLYMSSPGDTAGLPGIPTEPTFATGLSHLSGAISMARAIPAQSKSEFFICIGDQLQFDKSNEAAGDTLGYTVFGKVVEGMTVVRKIQAQKNIGDKIIYPVKIESISVHE